MEKIKNMWNHSVDELLNKVTWPTREVALSLTGVVLAVTITLSIVLGAIDLFYGWWFEQGINSTERFVFIAAILLAVFGVIGGFLYWRGRQSA